MHAMRAAFQAWGTCQYAMRLIREPVYDMWFGASGPDRDEIGDLDIADDVQVTPIGGCAALSGYVVEADGVADWGTNYYQKK